MKRKQVNIDRMERHLSSLGNIKHYVVDYNKKDIVENTESKFIRKSTYKRHSVKLFKNAKVICYLNHKRNRYDSEKDDEKIRVSNSTQFIINEVQLYQ